MNEKPQHGTITVERSYRAPFERVFSEFADPVARARWTPPSKVVLIYDEANFRAGGRDIFRCRPKNDPKFRRICPTLSSHSRRMGQNLGRQLDHGPDAGEG